MLSFTWQLPDYFQKKLTEQIVREAIQAYAENDGYWKDLTKITKITGREDLAILRGLEKLQDDINKMKKFEE